MVSSYTSSEEMSQQNSRSDQCLKSSSSKIYKKPQHSLAPAGSRPQPKVYKVKPIHFRELVQQLTGAPALAQAQARTQTQAQNRRSNLQSIAPPPLPLHHNHHQAGVQNQTHNMSITQQQAPAEPADQKPSLFGGFDSTTELTLSPNFQAWFAFAMLSPGAATVSQMEQRAAV